MGEVLKSTGGMNGRTRKGFEIASGSSLCTSLGPKTARIPRSSSLRYTFGDAELARTSRKATSALTGGGEGRANQAGDKQPPGKREGSRKGPTIARRGKLTTN
jgi:hypothetical protein